MNGQNFSWPGTTIVSKTATTADSSNGRVLRVRSCPVLSRPSRPNECAREECSAVRESHPSEVEVVTSFTGVQFSSRCRSRSADHDQRSDHLTVVHSSRPP